MKRLFMHIGTHKTGTTSLQYFLNQNRSLLLSQGFIYPEVPEGSLARTQHRYVMTIARNKPLLMQYFENAASLADQVIVSSECFLEKYAPPAAYQDLNKIFDEIYIIIYLRRQDEWIESNYRQHLLKMGLSLKIGFSEWLNHSIHRTTPFYYSFYWDELINKWSEVFGERNMVCRACNTVLYKGGSIFTDFAHILNLDYHNLFPPELPVLNSSKENRNFYELARICNLFMKEPEKLDILGNVDFQNYMDKYQFLSPDERLKIFETVYESNARVEAIYFEGKPTIFTDKMLHEKIPWEPYRGLPVDLVNQVIGLLPSAEKKDMIEYLKKYPADTSLKSTRNPGLISRFVNKVFHK